MGSLRVMSCPEGRARCCEIRQPVWKSRLHLISSMTPKRGKYFMQIHSSSIGVGLKGFEPSTSASRTQRSSQAELQPDLLPQRNHFRPLLARGKGSWEDTSAKKRFLDAALPASFRCFNIPF